MRSPMSFALRSTAGWVALLALPGLARPASAQSNHTANVYVDTAVAVDTSFDDDGRGTTGVIVDGIAEVGIGRGLQAIVRPFAQRLPSGEWNRQVWIAAVRYERSGPVGLRVDGGLIPPTVGLANLTLRPHLTPTVSQPASLFQALPSVEPGAPRSTLLGAVYPFGASVTVSGLHWDTRAAIMDTSPIRARRVFTRPGDPPRFANLVVGGGVTPVVGLRLGASVTRGGWRRATENAVTVSDQSATVVTVESEYAVRYTRLAGEWTYDRIGTQNGQQTSASGWFVVGQQTISPRWFAAARVERIAAPAVSPAVPAKDRRFEGIESVVGFRVTPELTLRAGYRTRRGFGRPTFDHQAVVSAVWWRRWM